MDTRFEVSVAARSRGAAHRGPAALPPLAAVAVVVALGCGSDAAPAFLGDVADDSAAGDTAPVDTTTDAPDTVLVDTGHDDTEDAPDGDTAADTAPADSGDSDTDAPCAGEGSLCTWGCGGDAFEAPSCVGGEWVCPEGTTPMDECPAGSCFGLPFPGEVCDDGWQCRPWLADGMPECDGLEETLCADCRGFDAYPGGECACTCEGGRVRCGDPPACEVGTASTDFGITLRIDLEDCVFTLAELAAGVTLPYTVELEDNGTWVWSGPLDAGRCDLPSAGGLRLLERVSGGDESWCVCDSGLCMDPDTTRARLVTGSYAGSIEWDGRNWFGPSDTGFEPGDPFPPGAYTFSVRAAGVYSDTADGDGLIWDVTASAPIWVAE